MSRRLMLGVIGHVDHGKTSLVRALTGIETDRLPEEQRRGISIALGFAHLTLDGAAVDIVDMPGHERFVRTMISGATGVDAVLLVVAANEGVMPQTREHVDIAGLLGIRHAVVAVTKADLADGAAAGAEAAALARAAGMQVTDVVPVSAVTGAGLDALRAALADVLGRAAAPEDAGFAYLPVDRAFSVAGHGTVITGTLRRGTLKTDEELEVLPGGAKLRIRGLQVHGAKAAQALPGQRVAVNLRGAELADVPRGVALAAPGLLTGANFISVSLRAVDEAPELPTGMRLMLLFGVEEVDIRLRLLDRDVLQPGDSALAQLRIPTGVHVAARERFVLRIASPPLTVAGGAVLDPATMRQRRHAPGVLARLAALDGAAPAAIVAAEVAGAGAKGVAVAALARLAGVAPVRAQAMLPDSAVLVGRVAVAGPAFADVLARVPAALAPHPAGLSKEALAALVPGASQAVVDGAVAQLVGRGLLRQSAGLVRVADAVRERDQAQAQDSAAAKLAEALRQGGLTPPEPWKLAPDPMTRKLLDRLIKEGVAIRALDRVQKREVVFHRDAVAQAQKLLTPKLAGGGLLVSEAGAALGISRKFSVPLLEHLDSIRFTRRVADRRVLATG